MFRCKSSFCRRCIKRNLGRSAVTAIVDNDEWRCLACDVGQIRDLRAAFFSIHRYWADETAKKARKEEAKAAADGNGSGNNVVDAVDALIEEAASVQKILKSYVDQVRREWGAKRVKHKAGSAAQADASLRMALKLKRASTVGRANLSHYDASAAAAMRRAFPAMDLAELLKPEDGPVEQGGSSEEMQTGSEVSQGDRSACGEDLAVANGCGGGDDFEQLPTLRLEDDSEDEDAAAVTKPNGSKAGRTKRLSEASTLADGDTGETPDADRNGCTFYTSRCLSAAHRTSSKIGGDDDGGGGNSSVDLFDSPIREEALDEGGDVGDDVGLRGALKEW